MIHGVDIGGEYIRADIGMVLYNGTDYCIKDYSASDGWTEITQEEAEISTAQAEIESLESAITEQTERIAELKSYIDSIGKTVLVGEGSEDSPFVWSVGCDLVPNAFYSYNSHVWVWMGTAGTATAADEPGTSAYFAQWDI